MLNGDELGLQLASVFLDPACPEDMKPVIEDKWKQVGNYITDHIVNNLEITIKLDADQSINSPVTESPAAPDLTVLTIEDAPAIGTIIVPIPQCTGIADSVK